MAEDFLQTAIKKTRERLATIDWTLPQRRTRPVEKLSAAIEKAEGFPVIAEIKHASPASGKIREIAEPVTTASTMLEGGAIAVSVITDPEFFGGSEDFVSQIREHVAVPILMKDFFIEERQIPRARALGADAILLIADACPSLEEFYELATHYGLELLVELGKQEHIDLVQKFQPGIVGINNRDLHTLQLDLNRTRQLAPLVRKACPNCVIVSESGITSSQDVRFVKEAGADAILVGTSLMQANDLRSKVRELVKA